MADVRDILALMKNPTKEDTALVGKAYAFAAEAHKDQKRFSGEPYLNHLVETAKGVAGLGLGAKTVAAALLHDSVEDTGVAPETIEKEFGKEVRFLVEGVTKLGKFKYRGTERHRESLRKLVVATSKDVRVLIIKLMDRLHNMKTLEYVKPEKRERIALETLEIYAAIAHRLGMGLVRRDLEDLAFEYAYPEEYAKAKQLLAEYVKTTTEGLENMSTAIKADLAKNNISDFRVDYRMKGLWSLWQKLKRKGGDINEVYDISALRVVVRDVADCYRVLGLVHNLWQPLPNKIKDYIAFPKPNGYQSLHTTVFSGSGEIVEVQIRTYDMHRESQFGIAAHVLYKEQGKTPARGSKHHHTRGGSSFDWVMSLLPKLPRLPTRNQPEEKTFEPTAERSRRTRRARYGAPESPEWFADVTDGMDDTDLDTVLKSDLFSHRLFVFTPKGDVVDLPLNSSPIDFAYAIHSDIGDHVSGAKVNGKLVSLDTMLHNGDIVDIQTRKSASPKQKWLDFTKTATARRHIRNLLEGKLK